MKRSQTELLDEIDKLRQSMLSIAAQCNQINHNLMSNIQPHQLTMYVNQSNREIMRLTEVFDD